MKKKNILIISISLLIIIITSIICYKVYNFRKYSFNSSTYEFLNDFTQKYNVKEDIKILKSKDDIKDYLTFRNIKIRNVFKNFVNEDGDVSSYYTAYNIKEDDKLIARFIMGIEDYTITGNMKKARAFTYTVSDGKESREDKVNIEKYFENNNINDDIDLLKYGNKHKDDSLNILTDSVLKRKSITYIYAFLNLYFKSVDEIHIISGDYKGYLTITNGDITKVSVRILDPDKAYYFTFFYRDDYYSLEDIKDIISTIQIS